jgi:hypothetical protein
VGDVVEVLEVERGDQVRRPGQREGALRHEEQAVLVEVVAREIEGELDAAVLLRRHHAGKVADDDVRQAVEARAGGAAKFEVLVVVGAGLVDPNLVDHRTRLGMGEGGEGEDRGGEEQASHGGAFRRGRVAKDRRDGSIGTSMRKTGRTLDGNAAAPAAIPLEEGTGPPVAHRSRPRETECLRED